MLCLKKRLIYMAHNAISGALQGEPYLSYNEVLKTKFGEKVYKLTLDGGFTCPNIDGTKGRGGCTFCDETGSSSRAQVRSDSITEQLLKNIERVKARFNAGKYIAYFQSYTNTYSRVERLKRLYDEALVAHPDIIGLAISTRPDSVDDEKLDLIASYAQPGRYLSIEYGMQTIHDTTLARVNRCETHADFLKAFYATRERQLSMCVHVILGMPGETHSEMMATADALSQLKPEGVKIHCMCAMANTVLAQDYAEGRWKPLEQEEYVDLVCDFIERLDPRIAIHRVGGNGHRDGLVAPRWLLKKMEVMQQLKETFARRGSCQGTHLFS
jgi:uncharacterized protein